MRASSGDLAGILLKEEAAVSFAKESGCTTVLKGHDTVTLFPTAAFMLTARQSGNGKGRSGDVLAGMLAGLLGQLPA
jgi:NAD(P)H-hydrate repair Nnr-like enzyme with NAD(P)H-hydrate dehydratase domain